MQLVQLPLSCNNACVFCAQGGLDPVGLTSPAEQLERLVAGVPVGFVGGEPTLHAELPAWVSRAARVAPTVVIQTNARRLPGMAAALVAAGATSTEVALHGDSAALHDYHSGVPGSFIETLAGLDAARAARLPFALTVVLTRSNWRHARGIVELAAASGARALRFSAVQPAGRAVGAAPSLVPPVALATPAVRDAQARATALGLPCFVGAVAPSHADSFCGMGLTAPPRPSRLTALRTQPASPGPAPPC